MNRGEIKSAVVAVLREVQESSGEAYVDLAGGDEPIGKLDGFDSLTGIEATVILEERLGCEIERSSVFVSEDENRASTLAEICGLIAGLLGSDEKAVA